METVAWKQAQLTLWDVGGRDKIRPLWRHYYATTQALVFVGELLPRSHATSTAATKLESSPLGGLAWAMQWTPTTVNECQRQPKSFIS